MTRTLQLPIEGMSCGSCVRHVQTALQGVAGVSAVAVHLAENRADVTFDPAAATLDAMREAVRAAGYTPGEVAP
jgi:copper chaperone CopZ